MSTCVKNMNGFTGQITRNNRTNNFLLSHFDNMCINILLTKITNFDTWLLIISTRYTVERVIFAGCEFWLFSRIQQNRQNKFR